MTFEEAKKILEKEFAVINLHKSTEPFEFDDSNWFGYEKPSVLEAFRVLSKEGYYITISGHDYDMRKKRLEKEYEKNTKAPGSAENSIKGDLSGNKSIEHCGEPIPGSPLSAVEGIKLKRKDNQNTSENPALVEAASQFNDALLDEQAKKIAELTKENERLEIVSKTTTDEFNKLYYRMIAKSDKIEALGKEIARLNKIIHKKNLKIEELRKESSRHLRGKMKMFGENFDFEQKLKDKDAVLADVAEELRLSKIREKNLTEVCQKYMKENEELKKELADKVVDKINAQALKSAESALAWKEKVIAEKDMALAYYEKKIAEKDEVIDNLRKELKAQKGLVNHISKKYDGAKINLNLRMKECEKLEEALDEKTNLVEMVRKGSKEYREYGIEAVKMIRKMAKVIVSYKPVVSLKDFKEYRRLANGYSFNPQLFDFSEEEEKKLSLIRDDSVGAVTNQKNYSPFKDTHPTEESPEEVELDEILELFVRL